MDLRKTVMTKDQKLSLDALKRVGVSRSYCIQYNESTFKFIVTYSVKRLSRDEKEGYERDPTT
jgi:ACT domain-containing protein